MIISLNEALKKALNESVEPKDINDAIQNQYQVIIKYSDEENHAPEKRVIEPYVYGLSKANNPVIRGFQYYGDTYRGIPHWKLFRIDRITYWQPTENHFNASPKERGWNAEVYQSNADKDMSQVFSYVSFNNEEIKDNDTLSKLRLKTQQLQHSKPINIKDIQKSTDTNNINNDYKKPVEKDKPEINVDLDNANNERLKQYQTKEFQDMLKRNMDITKKEKAKRNFNINNIKNKENNNGLQPNNQ